MKIFERISPELSVEKRELLINGVCRKCYPKGEEECES